MEEAENCVAPPPADEPDRVRIDACSEDFLCPPHSEGACADVLNCETNGRVCGVDHGSDGCRDIGAADGDPLVLVAHLLKRSYAGGAMPSKGCDAAT